MESATRRGARARSGGARALATVGAVLWLGLAAADPAAAARDEGPATPSRPDERPGPDERPAAATGPDERPAVARGTLRGAGTTGNVFFLAVEPDPGAVAVGAAHAFDRTALAEAGEVTFRLGGSGREVARSGRYYASPGRAYTQFGASLRDDHLVFALAAPPEGVRLLEPADALPRPGERVRILGLAGGPPEGPGAIEGRVAVAEETRIHVDLAGFVDLRGWGGGPVVDEDGAVVGLLQSAAPHEGGLRLGVGPVGGVVEALADPFEGGIGRLFATLAPLPSAATSHEARRRSATGSPFGAAAPEESAARVLAAAGARARAQPPQGSAASAASDGGSPLALEIDVPEPEALVGDTAGVFVAGHARALRDERRRFDVVIVIDTSASTSGPTGVDVDGDGEVGLPHEQPAAGFGPGSTDPGDSILAAEVDAARQLVAGLDPRLTRVGLVTFAGEPAGRGGRSAPGPRGGLGTIRRAAVTEEPLTAHYARLGLALDRLAERRPWGMTHMAAGVDLATLELLGLEGALSRPDPESEKIVLFLTDGTPTLPYPDSEAGNVRAVLASAHRARQAGVRVHTFAIGPEALEEPISAVELAAITDGLFTPVRDPGRLGRFVDTLSFARVDEVRVTNATMESRAFHAVTHADGSFQALVPLVEDANRLLVRARSRAGEEATRELVVYHVPGVRGAPLPVELVPRHNALLRTRLDDLRLERAEAVRRELVLEIERERAAAVERAARQRKELELEVAPTGDRGERP